MTIARERVAGKLGPAGAAGRAARLVQAATPPLYA
jgi:hypothetical protein